jgi:adenosylhomocysteine nucleosidase
VTAVRPRVLVVAPLVAERRVIAASLAKAYDVVPLPELKLDADYVPALSTVVAEGGHGKTQFGVQAQYLVERFPSAALLVCGGVAGALDPSLRVGDIVIGSETVEHDFQQRIVPKPPPRFAADQRALEQMRAVAASRSRRFRVTTDVVASGDVDCVERAQAEAIHTATGAACTAWEGAGAMRVARFNGIGGLEMRAISDSADEHAERDFLQNLALAMNNLGELLVEFLSA